MNLRKLSVIGCLLAAMISPCVAKDVQVMVSSRNNIMVRPIENKKYVLLPIEEAAPEARVQLMVDGKRVESFTARLSNIKVDYYVPVDVSAYANQKVLLNAVWGDNEDYTDNICWNNIKTSDVFDASNKEAFRPSFHHSPAYGWMNDPNGMYYDEKTQLWHLYYQYNPYGSMWGNMSWGHSVSKDLINWEAMPIAMKGTDLGMIFSGSCVIDKENVAGFGKDAVVAYYTAADASQMQAMAYSNDGGTTFTQYDGNPILTDKIFDFRDPKVYFIPQRGVWGMALACGQEIKFYSSSNLKDWTYDSSFGIRQGAHGGVWECPDLIQLPVKGTKEKKWVLIVNINPGGPAGGSACQYFVGDFDGTNFICNQKEAKWMDYGKDHYATVGFYNAPENRAVVMAWMSNWQYANQLPTKQFRSQNSLPRDLGLFKDKQGAYHLSVIPSKETKVLYGAELTNTKTNLSTKATNIAIAPSNSIYTIQLQLNKQNTAHLVFANDKGDSITISYNAQNQELTFVRPQSNPVFSGDFAATCVAKVPMRKGDNAQKINLTIFQDNLSMEVFDSEGRTCMTNLVFPVSPYTHIKAYTNKGTAKLTVKQNSIAKNHE